MFWTSLKNGKFAHIAISAFLLGFVFVSLFGISMSMQTRGDGAMEGCPFAGNAAVVCSMTAVDHIAQWQRMFTAAPSERVLAALTALFAFFIFYLPVCQPAKRRDPVALSYWFYKQEHPDSKLFDFLVAFFARGILQPKLYAR